MEHRHKAIEHVDCIEVILLGTKEYEKIHGEPIELGIKFEM